MQGRASWMENACRGACVAPAPFPSSSEGGFVPLPLVTRRWEHPKGLQPGATPCRCWEGSGSCPSPTHPVTGSRLRGGSRDTSRCLRTHTTGTEATGTLGPRSPNPSRAGFAESRVPALLSHGQPLAPATCLQGRREAGPGQCPGQTNGTSWPGSRKDLLGAALFYFCPQDAVLAPFVFSKRSLRGFGWCFFLEGEAMV